MTEGTRTVGAAAVGATTGDGATTAGATIAETGAGAEITGVIRLSVNSPYCAFKKVWVKMK